MKNISCRRRTWLFVALCCVNAFVDFLLVLLFFDVSGVCMKRSSGFSVEKWGRINLGMTEHEIVRTIGEPLQKLRTTLYMVSGGEDYECWQYTRKRKYNICYRKYCLFFDKDGRVGHVWTDVLGD